MGRTTLAIATAGLLLVCSLGAVWAQEEFYTHNRTNVAAGLSPYYRMVTGFLDAVKPPDEWAGDVVDFRALVDASTRDDELKKMQTDWEKFMEYFLGYAICVALGVVLIIILIFSGLGYCCGRCCGKCGCKANKAGWTRKKMKGCGCAMVVFTSILLAGVVMVFVTNEAVYKGLSSDQGLAHSTADTVRRFQAYTVYITHELASLTSTISSEVTDMASQLLQLPHQAQVLLLETLNSSYAFNTGYKLDMSLNSIQNLIQDVEARRQNLTVSGTALHDLVTTFKDDLTVTLAGCPANLSSACSDLQTTIQSLSTPANFSTVQDYQAELKKASDLVNSNLTNLLMQDEVALDAISQRVNSSLSSIITDVLTEMTGVADTILNTMVTSVVNVINQAADEVFGGVAVEMTTGMYESLSLYGDYWRYAGLGIGCLLLVVVLCYFVGLILGCCGRRPYEGCCNKDDGAAFMLAGAIWTFLFVWILVIVVILLMVLGGFLFTEVCQPLNTFGGTGVSKEVVQTVSDILSDLSITQPMEEILNVTVYDIAVSSYNDEPLYQALHIYDLVDLNQLLNISQYPQVLTSLEQLGNQLVSVSGITVASPATLTLLDQIRDSQLETMDLTSLEQQLNASVISPNVTSLKDDIEGLASQATATDEVDFAAALMNYSYTITRDLQPAVQDITVLMSTLSGTVNALKKELLLPEPLNTRAQETITALQNLETGISGSGSSILQQYVQGETMKLYNQVDVFLQSQSTYITTTFLKIGPVNRILDGYIQYDVCYDIVTSVNAFWFSVGWCVAFLIPCLIIALLLEKEYRREPYRQTGDHKMFDDLYMNGGVDNNSMDRLPKADAAPSRSVGGAWTRWDLPMANVDSRGNKGNVALVGYANLAMDPL